jgi:signal transduction histidine kinase
MIEFIINLLHELFSFLGTFQGELFKHVVELALFLFASYMIYIEYLQEKKKEYLFLLIAFLTLTFTRLVSSALLFASVFGGVDVIPKGTLVILANIVEAGALFLLVNSFIYPLLPTKSQSRQKCRFLLRNTFVVMVLILIGVVATDFIFKDAFVNRQLYLLFIAFSAQILFLYQGSYFLLKHRGKVSYQDAAIISLLVYSIAPLINLLNIITFGRTGWLNPSLIVAAHPFPFIAVALLLRLLYLRLANKAYLFEKLETTQNKYEKEKELCKMKDDFISVVSHELKTPITSMKLFVSMLKEGKLGAVSPQQADALDVVRKEGDRLNALINDVLTLSKLEANKQKLNKKSFNLLDLLKDPLYLTLAAKKGLAIRMHIPRDMVVDADQGMIKQIFVNLLNNAIKFTDKGGKITVKAGEGKNKWHFSISDTGKGMSKESLPKLFDKFYQTEHHMKRSKGGFGLGLSIVKHIVDLHKGQINVESEVGKGTTFHISFPKKL